MVFDSEKTKYYIDHLIIEHFFCIKSEKIIPYFRIILQNTYTQTLYIYIYT